MPRLDGYLQNPLQSHVETLLRVGVPSERREQQEYAVRVAAALALPNPDPGDDAYLTLLEASTGVGKTLGYLIPAAINAAITGERTLVSTYTRALSRQIYEHEAPRVARMVKDHTGKDVTFARRLGRRNFCDADRIDDLIAELQKDDTVRTSVIEALRDWFEFAVDNATSGMIQEAEDEYGLELPSGIAHGDICLLQNRRNGVSLSKFKAHIDDTHNADIIITTHALSLIDALQWGRVVVDGGDTPIRIGIFDEADRLVDAAQGLTGVRIRLTESDAPKDVVAAAQGLIEANNGDGIEIDLTKTEHSSFVDLIDQHRGNIDGADIWLEAAKERGVLHATVDPSPTSNFPAITALALFPARVLSRLWNKSRYMRSVIFTSATLGRDFESEIKATNIQRDISFSIEPKQFGKLSFMLSDDNAPEPMIVDAGERQTNPDFMGHVADVIKQAHSEGGRCLVLVPSYNDVDGLYPLFVDRGLDVLLHRRGEGLAPLLEDYKLKDDAILISPGAWEGVDLPGLVDHLIIGRIPFSPPDSAREAVMGPQAWRSIIRGMRRLKQGIGRALRRPEDVAKVWIADPRFPLPNALTRDPLKRVYSSRGVASLVGAVPKRFRTGALASYNRAEVIRTSVTEAA